MLVQVSVGDRILIQEDATGQAQVHQLSQHQVSPPLDYRGLAADALSGNAATGGSDTGSADQAQSAGGASALKVYISDKNLYYIIDVGGTSALKVHVHIR